MQEKRLNKNQQKIVLKNANLGLTNSTFQNKIKHLKPIKPQLLVS